MPSGVYIRKPYPKGTKRPGKMGSKNHNWIDGRRATFVGGEERRGIENRVALRDNFTCVKCGYYSEEYKRGAIDVDHILPKKFYPELKWDPNNMEVLCPNCHRVKTLKDKEKYKVNLQSKI